MEQVKNINNPALEVDSKILDTPVGLVTISATKEALVSLLWRAGTNAGNLANPILRDTESQLKEYFGGQRKRFDLPLALSGTEFQIRAWKELMKIPFGEYITYKQQAERIGNPAAIRAIGAANGQNRISIIVPCHRVVASSGALQGFAGGLDVKRRLLTMEGLAPTDWGFRKQAT